MHTGKPALLYSLRAQLLVFFSLLLLGTLTTLQIVDIFGLPITGFQGSYRERVDAAGKRLALIADLRKDALQAWIGERRNDARLLAGDHEVAAAAATLAADLGDAAWPATGPQGPAFKLLSERVSHLYETRAANEEVMIVDAPTRRVLASSREDRPGTSLRAMPFIEEALRPGYRETIDVVFSPLDGRRYLAIARQVLTPTGNAPAAGVRALAIQLIATETLLQPLLGSGQQGLGATGEIVLVGEGQRLLTAVRYPLPGGSHPQPLEFVLNSRLAKAATAGQEGVDEDIDYRGTEVLTAYRHLRISPDFGWGMLVKQDRAEILAAVWRSLAVHLVVAAASLVLTIGLIIWVATRLTRPLHALGWTARRVAAGQLDERAPIVHLDETGDIAQSFNLMLDRVAASQRDLEGEVDRRTRQLRRLNRLYATLSETNQTIIRIGSRDRLFREICRIAVEYGDLDLAWISLIDADGAHQTAATAFSKAGGLLEGEAIPCAPSALGDCHLSVHCCCSHCDASIAHDKDPEITAGRWREMAESLGFRSAASFPIEADGKLIGGFTLFSAEADFFERDVLALLEEMARDVSYAIDSLTREVERRQAEQALRDSELRLRSVVGGAPVVLFAVDEQGVFLLAEGRGLAAIGLKPGELVGHSAFERYADHPDICASLRRAMDGRAHTALVELRGATFEVSYAPMRTPGGAGGAIGVALDVTEKTVAEREATRAKRFAEQLVQSANVMIVGLDAESRIVLFNDTAENLTGHSYAELAGKNWFDTVVPRERYPEVWYAFREMLAGNDVQDTYESPLLTRHGEERVVSWRISRFSEPEQPARLVSFGIDVTEQKRAEAALHHHAFHDPLTDLPNRALFMDRLDHALARMRRNAKFQFAVLFLDLDRFKYVNDSLGHLAGDQLLVAVAAKLEGCIRPGDTVSRIGGDEFAMLLEDIDEVTDSSHVAERIHAALAAPLVIGGSEIFTSASVGITLSGPGYASADELLRDADTAMYQAKGQGKGNSRIFDAQMHTTAVDLLHLESDLRRGLERGEFLPYYQPIYSAAGKRLVGFEALARWQHPQRGLVPPMEFIPLAEETGLIREIGRQILNAATRQMRRWCDAYPGKPPLYVSVNLSARQFQDLDLVDRIEEALADTGLPPACLRLEITESVLMGNLNMAEAMLDTMVGRGLRLYLDDFGTGYSSLAYLHRLPFDALKIDRGFVAGMEAQGRSRGMVPTIIALARNLGMEVIAEGVETEHQLSHLQQLGCDLMQGYYISHPVPAEQADALLAGDPIAIQPSGSARSR